MSIQKSPFRILFKLPMSQKRMIVVSMMDTDTMWFNEHIVDKEYTGFTQKGFALRKQDAQDFIAIVRDVVTQANDEQRKLSLDEKKILVIQSPEGTTVDIRQYLIDPRGYTGPTRKGIRLVFANAIKLCDALNKYLSDVSSGEEALIDDNERSNDIEQPNTIHLDRAFDVHGKKCYVCQTFYSIQLRNLTLYYADGDKTNSDENNMYPICAKCLAAM